ncbi:putative sodium solute symporter protein [Botrytis fragariae]|uniref:Putative sodium solute symporter protein n=1 Tax=Botrytis fragariae TaxID=1964551 RepID=A0A8H6EI64_9HELO|nr:putative sodium solute symporter protein [Botrytis fragariae]KAF5873106.1 putative sodium solute symporter protein [Botrytis fragariae]
MAVQLLTQADGYGIIVGLSILFCLIILAAVRIQKRYLSEDSDQSEMFMVANRSVGTGLTASAVFSSWMWINESVFSAAYTYKWGIALPIWWASGLSFQIALMAVLGIVAKLRVPYAHTSLEFIRMRYGNYAHWIFIVLNLINNIFGCGSMILAGAQLVTGMTGMHVVAACVLIPAGVVIYTAVGGLKATFLTDFLHTTVALILLIYFSLAVLSNEHIGGVSGLYEKVKATDDYIPGNYEGSLLTMKSKSAVLFGLVLKFGNLALVLMDTAFWQKSFASEVHSTVPAYDLVSIVIIAIPWCTGTIIGLSARAIEKTPIWFDYPNTLTTTQVNSGMVMPYVLRSLLGKGATTGLLVLVFMAITSTVSSSMIAVSSIISLDFFRTYINPAASDRKTLKVSHWGVVFHGCFMAGFAIMLEYAGATNNWSTYFRPIIACPGILPMIFTLLWSRQTKLAAILAPILGLMSGVATWLSLSWYWSGALNIQTTQVQIPGLYGAIVSFFSPGIYSIPSKQLIDIYTPSIEVVNQVTHAGDESKKESYTTSGDEAGPPSPPSITPNSQLPLDDVVHPFGDEVIKHINKWLKIASVFFVVNVLVTIVLWPIPLYRDWIFTKSFFSGWVVMAIVWHFFAILAVVVYPVWDGRIEIVRVVKGMKGEWER